jgi:aminoglycoside 6'-N-acetyltransferase I
MSLCEIMMGRHAHLAPTVLMPMWAVPFVHNRRNDTGLPLSRERRDCSTVVPDKRATASADPELSVVQAQVRIRPVRRADNESWAALRQALWPDTAETELHLDIERWWWTADRDTHCLVAEVNRRLVGFIELSIRPNAEGCETDRVAYVEGWYVAPDVRRRGIGRALMTAAEVWSGVRGCKELGSDSDVANAVGQGAHRAFGFAEVATLVCFRKVIG